MVFTGPESGVTATTARITLSATVESTVESTGETVVIGLGSITGLEDGGGVSQTDSLEDFSISDAVGVTVSPNSLSLTELGAPMDVEKEYTIVLDTDPGADVSIRVSNSDSSAVEVDTDSSTPGNQSTLTFTHGNSGNWNMEQPVTVRVLNDSDATGETVNLTHAATVSDTNNPYDGISIDPVVVSTTDAGHGVVVSEEMVSVGENDGEVSYTVVLKSEPSGAVEISATSDATTMATVSPATLTFTASEWKEPQTVTVTGKGAGTTSIRHAVARSGDSTNYPTTTTIPAVPVTVTAVAGLVIIETDGETTVSEDGTTVIDTYTIALTVEPTHDVTVTVTAGGGAQVNITGGSVGSEQSLTFTPRGANIWSTAQTVTVTGVDDELDNVGDARTVTIAHAASSDDTRYDIEDAGSVSVTVSDDDEAGVTVSPLSLSVTELGDSSSIEKSYTVVLDTDPGMDVTITVNNGDNSLRDLRPIVVDTDSGAAGNQTTLTFTSGNWDTPQTVTVRALNDRDGANESVSLTHSAVVSDTSNPYHGISIDPVMVSTTDAGHGVVVSEEMVSVDENDEEATYTVVLKSRPGQPDGRLTIEVRSGSTGTATVSPARHAAL